MTTPAALLPTPRRLSANPRTGIRLPPRSMYVGRTSRFGNPFAVQRVGQRYAVIGMPTTYESQAEANTVAVGLYREWVGTDDPRAAKIRRDLHILRALDSLACNCAPELDCHVDVLIELLARYATA